MKYEKRKIFDLIFNYSIPTIDFNTNLPILIDNENKVYLGNCLRNVLNIDVNCIVIQNDNYALKTLNEFEMAIANENNRIRLQKLEKEIKIYINTFANDLEDISLWQTKEKHLITEENYIKPLVYNHENIKKKEDEYASLFSSLGE